MYVADRLIDAVCEIDYPRELLEIQVLDDSTDETTSVAERAVRRNAEPGASTSRICTAPTAPATRPARSRPGMKVAKGEFIAIFDADFIPTTDFLQRTVPFFVDPKIAHGAGALGPHQSGLLAPDEDSVDPARRRTSCSSTAGATGRASSSTSTARPASGAATAIVDAGGWQHDTLTEDLDLSYRAQLRGWKFVFLPDLVAPAEVPVEMNSFKSQQHRWAKGSIQTCRKLLPTILRSNLPLGVKAEAFFHLTANFNYPLMCVLSVLMAPSMVIRYNMGWYEMLLIDVPLFFAATASVANFYMVCQRELHKDWIDRAEVPAVPDVGRHRPGRQQHQGRVRGACSTSRASSRARRSTASKGRSTSGSARSTARTSWCSR